MTDLLRAFDGFAHQLDTKAQQLQQGTQLIKAGSMLSTTLGLIGLAGTGLGAVPLAVGLGLYGFAVSREKGATGRFMPLPWSQASGAAMAAGAIQQDIETVDIPVTDYDYLSQDDKADYTLFGVMAPVIAPMIEGATPVQQERWLTQARRSLIKYHPDLISDPELMAPALYGSIDGARGAFAKNLPDDMQALVSPRILQAATKRRYFSAGEAVEATAEVMPHTGGQTMGGAAAMPEPVGAIAAPVATGDSLADETLIALKDYVQQPKNLVMVASGGAGKGITLANLCRFRAEANPSFRAIWFEPKNDPDETGYMDHPCIDAIRFNAAELPGEVVVQKVRDMMNRFRELCAKLPPKTPVWLILDEWYFVLSVLQQYDTDALNDVIAMLRSTVSLMDAKHKHIVLVGQSPNLDDLLPGQGGLMANLNTLCLFKRDSSGIKLLEKAGQTGVMPRKQATSQRLYQAAAQSPRDRAMFFGDRLWPAPELVNYGNYDRDNGKHLGKPVAALKTEAAPKAIAQPVEFNPDDIQPNEYARQMIANAYAESNDKPAADGGTVHPKAKRFAEVVGEYFEANPDKQSAGLGKIINNNAKLLALRKANKKDAIEKLMHLAAEAGLLQIEEVSGGWSITNPSAAHGSDWHNEDELDLDF